jgi:hypothetical protein
MGSNFATELADKDLFPELDLESAIGMHLQANHYPPVPYSMVVPCIDAIDAYWEEDYNREIELPQGVTWRGKTKAPANYIVEAHHLDAWLPQDQF